MLIRRRPHLQGCTKKCKGLSTEATITLLNYLSRDGRLGLQSYEWLLIGMSKRYSCAVRSYAFSAIADNWTNGAA